MQACGTGHIFVCNLYDLSDIAGRGQCTGTSNSASASSQAFLFQQQTRGSNTPCQGLSSGALPNHVNLQGLMEVGELGWPWPCAWAGDWAGKSVGFISFMKLIAGGT